jgi:hypothetical protein
VCSKLELLNGDLAYLGTKNKQSKYMKITQYIYLFLAIFVMLMIASNGVNAQKKPKLKGLAKELIGTWKLESMEIILFTTENKLTEDQKKEYQKVKAIMPLASQAMKGMESYTFNADGTYKIVGEGKNGLEEKIGKWKLEKNILITTLDNVNDSEDKREIFIKEKKLNFILKKEGEFMGGIQKFVK